MPDTRKTLRRDEAACRRRVDLGDQPALGLHFGGVVRDRRARFLVDDRADIGGDRPWVADRQLLHRALQHLDDLLLDVLLDVEDPQRRAALAGALEGRGEDVAHRLFGQRRGIDDHRVEAAGLGDQHRVGRGSLGKLAFDQARDLGRAGEADAGDARIGGQRPADRRPVTRQQLQHILRNARLMQQRHGARGDQRRLLGGLGQHRVAGDKRRRDLAGENRQRKIPRRDADDRAARRRAGFRAFGLGRVVAQEVDGLAHFGDAVGQRLAGLAGGQREEFDGVGLVEVGGAPQHRRPLGDRRLRPARLRRDRDADGGLDLFGGGLLHACRRARPAWPG